MAYITVKSGIVGRNLKDKGFELLEKFEVGGNPVTRRYAVWCNADLIPAEGLEIDVTGIPSNSVVVKDANGKVVLFDGTPIDQQGLDLTRGFVKYENTSINKPRFETAAYRQKSVAEVAKELDDSPF